MADNIDLNQIAVVLSQLVHNYNVLAQNWFKVFYDSTPDGNIQLTFFDEEGNLLGEKLKAWYLARNSKQKGVSWHFSSQNARVKLKHLYPNIKF